VSSNPASRSSRASSRTSWSRTGVPARCIRPTLDERSFAYNVRRLGRRAGRATGDVGAARSRLPRDPPTARSIQRRPPARLRPPSVWILGPPTPRVLKAH
jgi:hypothetical protein